MLSLSVSKPDFAKAFEKIAVDVREKLRLVADSVGIEVIAYLKSKTEEMRPPARKGGIARQAHPGHWADVTGQLVNSYQYDVTQTANGTRLRIRNTSDHAVYLELHDGMFVVSGVMQKGGEVETALLHVIPLVAPGWKVDVSRLTLAG